MNEFFIGLHQTSDTEHFDSVFMSVNRLKNRKNMRIKRWIMDSGAFSTILSHGGYPNPPEHYAAEIKRWSHIGTLLAAVAQDYMCEDHMLKITGMSIPEHQRLTIERYDELTQCDTGGVYIMPVLQGYAPEDYARHVDQYGDRLQPGMWVGVGSVCKRNSNPSKIEEVLAAVRPDLKLHGFGIKITALKRQLIKDRLHTADSMAWSYAARREGRNQNDWREAARYLDKVKEICNL